MTLQELAELVEGAEGPSRELDARIAPLVGLRVVDEGHPLGRVCYDKHDHGVPLPAFTGSLDAAMTLVPEKSWVRMDQWPRDFCAPVASVTPIVQDTGNPSYSATGSTLALALCAASLRAIARAQAPAPETGEGV